MQLLWVDKSLPNKDKIDNYQLDSSRTTDTISNLANQDEIPNQKNENEVSDFPSSKFGENNNNEEMLNLLMNLKDDKKEIKTDIILFKKRLSIALCGIYLLLFLISIPKIPKKIGEEQKFHVLMQNNTNKNINILINNFNFYCNKNINSNSQKEEQNDNCEMTGYLLEFSTNKMFIFRWLIGFIYFIFKCIFFIYSNNKNTNNDNMINTKILKLFQKISMLIFPLSLFVFDLQNNISFSKINLNHSYDKTVSFYIMNEKRFSPIDYVEGLIPTIFTFLISFDYNNIDKIINNYVVKTKKLNKLV